MKKLFYYSLILLLSILTFISCSFDKVIASIKETESFETRTANSTTPNFGLKIVNKTEDLLLTIDSCTVHNIMNENGDLIQYTLIKHATNIHPNDYIYTPHLYIIPQTLTPWIPTSLPSNSDGSYVKINGSVKMISQNDHITINSGEMFIPLRGNVTQHLNNIKTLTLQELCNWYYQSNDTMYKVLTPINFNVSVDGWIEIQYNCN